MKLPTLAKGTAALVLTGLIAVVGCGSSKGRATVKGTVSVGPKKLNSGNVTFKAKDGRTGSGAIDENGNYSVPDAPQGECTVIVVVRTAGAMMMPGGMAPPSSGGLKTPPVKTGMDKMGSFKAVDPSKVVQIPPKYGSSETSDLTYTVKSGEQTYNIELKP